MKLFFIAFVAIIAIASVAFAQTPTLPDYQKDGRLGTTYLCDSNKTTVKDYYHKDGVFAEIRTSSGAIFVNSPMGFYMQAAGSKEMKRLPHKEWDAELEKQSPDAYEIMHFSGPYHCKKQ